MTDDTLHIISDPGEHGDAGLGVRLRDDARGPVTRVTIEQLWPNGDAEPIYVTEAELPELIYTLMEVHMEVMDE